jgi:hypothetical protein
LEWQHTPPFNFSPPNVSNEIHYDCDWNEEHIILNSKESVIKEPPEEWIFDECPPNGGEEIEDDKSNDYSTTSK